MVKLYRHFGEGGGPSANLESVGLRLHHGAPRVSGPLVNRRRTEEEWMQSSEGMERERRGIWGKGENEMCSSDEIKYRPSQVATIPSSREPPRNPPTTDEPCNPMQVETWINKINKN